MIVLPLKINECRFELKLEGGTVWVKTVLSESMVSALVGRGDPALGAPVARWLGDEIAYGIRAELSEHNERQTARSEHCNTCDAMGARCPLHEPSGP